MTGVELSAYDSGFFETQIAQSRESAQVVVPLLQLLLGDLRSVLDVGGGAGAWAATWAENGVDALDVDGEYVKPAQLLVPRERFMAHDLTKPLDLGRRFDLVTCLEVAEHVEPAHAETLIGSLVRHGDLIVFSAAVPGQGGTNHVNEQWPEYWLPMFTRHGFEVFDVLRPRLWHEEAVGFWFRQNLLIYAKGAAAGRVRALPSVPLPLNLIHPEQFATKVRQLGEVPPIRVSAKRVADGLRRRLGLIDG